MSERPSSLHIPQPLEVPPHFYDFAQLSTDILSQAHEGTLLLPDASIRAMYSGNAHRVYIEKNEEWSREYERLAVHLGETCLTVCVEHRHDKPFPQPSELSRTTVLIEHGEARRYHSRVTSGPDRIETITGNEAAGLEAMERLQHVLSSIGIRHSEEVASFSIAS